MLSTLILYLTQKFETFNYLQKVYGLGVAREINESKLISVYDGNTEQHLNLDTHESLSVFLTNGNKTVEQIESEVVANEYHVKHTYPFKCLIYAKSNENVNCSSQSRLIADSIEKSITGRQKALLTSTQLVNAYIEVKNTTLEKHTLYANYFTGGGLGDNDILIEIEFDFIVEGNQNCFVDSPCAEDDFVFDFEPPQTFCERVDECLGIPTADGQYVLDITDGVKSWTEYLPSGAVVISKTEAQFNALVAAGTLQYPAVYKITDIQQGLYVNTLSGSTYSESCNLILNCPKTYETTTLDGNVWKGIWRASKTANINDLFIWGGVVWRNKTGNIGTATDVVTLDSTNWEYIDRNNFNNNEYIPLSLICYYDFEQSWINYLQDEHLNIIGVDWHLNQIYGLNYNPSLQTDWNCMTKTGVIFTLNKLFYAINNLGSVIHNIANGSIFNNDYDVQDNKYCSVISNNTAAVYENIAAISDIDGAVNEVYNVNGGTFFFSHNFGTSPLTSGNSLLFNYIPEDASITNIKAYGTLTGTTIEIGLETDDEGLINEAVGLLPLEWSGVSAAATANRSLKIKATGGNITAGTLTVKVEFTI